MNWSELFPEGRDIFYEGTDPKGFIAEMVSLFRFDPSASSMWAECYGFHCPPEYIDEIYGSGKWVLGS